MKQNIKNLTESELTTYFESINEKKYRIKQLYNAMYSNGIKDFKDISSFSPKLRERLSGDFDLNSLKITNTLEADDGSIKIIFSTSDDNIIETVVLENAEQGRNPSYSRAPAVHTRFLDNNVVLAKKRNTLCVSTMIGCPVGCKFCATAKLKYKRALDVSEILDQILLDADVLLLNHSNNHFIDTCCQARLPANALSDKPTTTSEAITKSNSLNEKGHLLPIKNIVFMGMGEPFMNYENLINSIKIIRREHIFPDKAITISTIGIPDRIADFANLGINIKLALSLHSPFDEIRQGLIPVASKYKLQEILQSLEYYYRNIYLPITFEYILFRGVNDRAEDIKKLVAITRRFPSKVNLIPYNDISFTDANIDLTPCNDSEIKTFAKELYRNDVMVTTRKSQGQAINAACGQLAYTINKE